MPHSEPGTAADPVVSILIVSYNTKEMTLDCLRSIAEQTKTPHEVIVVDNDSPDASAEAIAEAFPGVRLMAEKINHGFAKSNNIAAGVARGEYILLLNPDTVVLDGAIDRLVEFARARPAAKIWGGRTLYGDRSLNATNCWRSMSLWNVFCRTTGLSGAFARSELFNSESYGRWPRDTERAVDVVCGAFLLIPRALWNALGGFDLRFVMYGEEADLCQRARARGAAPRITPEAEIVHYVGASKFMRSSKRIMLLNGKILLVKRHFPAWQRGLGVAMFRMWPLTRWLSLSLAARLRGGTARAENAASWREVWQRRAEWWEGYGPDPQGIPGQPSRAS